MPGGAAVGFVLVPGQDYIDGARGDLGERLGADVPEYFVLHKIVVPIVCPRLVHEHVRQDAVALEVWPVLGVLDGVPGQLCVAVGPGVEQGLAAFELGFAIRHGGCRGISFLPPLIGGDLAGDLGGEFGGVLLR
ncbi:hypothetical protein PG995_006095 [Apiospora arundinis]